MGQCLQTGQDVLSTLRQLNHTPSPQLKAAERGWSKKAGRPQPSAAAVPRPAVVSQALIPFTSLGYAPGSACTDSVAAAAQARLDELSMPSAVQLLWTLAYLQALPGRAWTMLMSRVVEQLDPFTDLAGEACVPACQTMPRGLAGKRYSLSSLHRACIAFA